MAHPCGIDSGPDQPCRHQQKLDFATDELGRILARAAVSYRYELHPGAEHGYALPDRDIYDKRATARDWELILAMYRRQIPLATTQSHHRSEPA
jgi:hypothetical protein